MARDLAKILYIIVLILTVVFAIVELGLASDLVRKINQGFFAFGSIIRPRTRYLVFCSSWGILAGLMLLMFITMAESTTAIIVQVIVMFFSMIFWLLAASLFTSMVGGGIDCGPQFSNCNTVNIINSTLAFAWINWSFVLIGWFLSLWLVFFGRHREQRDTPRQMGATNAPPVSNAPPQANAPQNPA